MKLVHAATAPDQLTAEMWCELLKNEGVPAMVEPKDVITYYLGVSFIPCRILVPEDRLEEAKEILGQLEEGEDGVEEEKGH